MLCLPGWASAASMGVIYKGEDTVDMKIYNYSSPAKDRIKFILERDGTEIWSQEASTAKIYYYSDSEEIVPFSSHTYTLLSSWSTDGTAWINYETDIKDVDTAIMSGTLHNDIDWQILLDRDTVYWDTLSAEYTVSYVNVADGDLGIYNTIVRLNDNAYRLKATGPGTITAEGVIFTSTTSAGGEVEFENQSDLSAESDQGVHLPECGSDDYQLRRGGDQRFRFQ